LNTNKLYSLSSNVTPTPSLLKQTNKFSLENTGDGYSCTNIDECDVGTHTCDRNAACSDKAGSFACSCNIGYEGTTAINRVFIFGEIGFLFSGKSDFKV